MQQKRTKVMSEMKYIARQYMMKVDRLYYKWNRKVENAQAKNQMLD